MQSEQIAEKLGTVLQVLQQTEHDHAALQQTRERMLQDLPSLLDQLNHMVEAFELLAAENEWLSQENDSLLKQNVMLSMRMSHTQ